MLENERTDIENMLEDESDIIRLLSEMNKFNKEHNKLSLIKITVCVVGGIGSLMMMGLLCYRLINTDFSFDSILSLLLAFFSIFISIFFYFKADETSTNFYKSSYNFMKDISVTLGKIEERFGEKLNSLNDKISHLDIISTEKSEEIKEQKEDKDKIINDLMDKANLDDKEKKKLRAQLKEHESQIERLKEQKFIAEKNASFLRSKLQSEITEMMDRYTSPTSDLRRVSKLKISSPLDVKKMIK